jgi:hypothetical protein
MTSAFFLWHNDFVPVWDLKPSGNRSQVQRLGDDKPADSVNRALLKECPLSFLPPQFAPQKVACTCCRCVENPHGRRNARNLSDYTWITDVHPPILTSSLVRRPPGAGLAVFPLTSSCPTAHQGRRSAAGELHVARPPGALLCSGARHLENTGRTGCFRHV